MLSWLKLFILKNAKVFYRFPTIVYFTPRKSTYKYKYNGNRSFDDLKSWILANKENEDANTAS